MQSKEHKNLDDLIQQTIHRIDKIAVLVERLETVTARHTRQIHNMRFSREIK